MPVPRIFHFYSGIGTGIGKIWYWTKVSEPVSEKFGTEKRYRYRYRKYLAPEKSIGIGIVQHFGYRHTLLTENERHTPKSVVTPKLKKAFASASE